MRSLLLSLFVCSLLSSNADAGLFHRPLHQVRKTPASIVVQPTIADVVVDPKCSGLFKGCGPGGCPKPSNNLTPPPEVLPPPIIQPTVVPDPIEPKNEIRWFLVGLTIIVGAFLFFKMEDSE